MELVINVKKLVTLTRKPFKLVATFIHLETGK